MRELTPASSSPDRQALARYLLECVWTMATSVHRRVETVSFRDDRWATRRVSVDFTAPADEGGAFGGGAPMLVPLTFLRQRQVLRNFDCRDSAGNTLPVLTRAEYAQIHRDMLLEAAWLTLGHLDETVVAAVTLQARHTGRQRAVRRRQRPAGGPVPPAGLDGRPPGRPAGCQVLLRRGAGARPRRPARRRRRAHGWRNETVEFPVRSAALGQSYHFAVNPPPEVLVDSTDLVETVPPDRIGLPEPEVWGCPRAPGGCWAHDRVATNVRLELAVREDGWLQTALASAWVTGGVLLAGAWGSSSSRRPMPRRLS